MINETFEQLNVNADCNKKKNKCDCEYNSAECKLRYFTASCNVRGLKDTRTKDELIMYLSERSDRYGDKLVEFMDNYHLISLQEATVEQLREYVDKLNGYTMEK